MVMERLVGCLLGGNNRNNDDNEEEHSKSNDENVDDAYNEEAVLGHVQLSDILHTYVHNL